ncbi:ABC-type transporter, permease and ATPase components [Paracholeplasma brassicae]|uniref:ABC-type transporter, permease and ATPase components n=1 Tax=Acholeplasma brassicae TaxID=61635 RepID=U4KPK5_9MOLU|nr:ABC transporter ATP-binding protein [Paracholeplasma brassicae]CCV66305.1 ABC-type transporter, permease and ATPase components [Paracholeplasma brassicae]
MRLFKLIRTAKGSYLHILYILILVVIGRFTYSYVPLFTQYVFDMLKEGSSNANFPTFFLNFLNGFTKIENLVVVIATTLVFYQLIRFTLIFFEEFMRGRLAEHISKTLRDRLYSHIQSLDYNYHNNVDTGDLVQRVTTDIEAMSNFVSNRIPEFIRLIATVTFGAIQIYTINQTMVWIALGMIPITAVSSVFFFKYVDKSFKHIEESEARMMTVIQENLTGARIVRAFANEQFEINKLEKENKSYSEAFMKFQKASSMYWGLSDVLAMFQYLITVIVGVYFVRQDMISSGQIVAVLMLLGMLIWPVRGLGRMIGDFGRALVSTSRIYEILELKSEFIDNGTLKPEVQGEIRFENVSYQFPDANEAILKDVSFTIKPKETVAIIGKTGSGKTTIINLLSRMIDPTTGAIYLDGVNTKEIEKHYLRKQMGIVLQEPFLFSKTVYENIAIVSPLIKKENVMKAAQIAAIERDIASFERGYETIVGERGTTLSGGQKQRVAIARVLVEDKPILIFDDSLSAVDTETDLMIRNALKEKEAVSTTIIITHRITTAKQADKIIVVEDGKISDIGTHETLYKKEGLYQKLWDIQGKLEQEFLDLLKEVD